MKDEQKDAITAFLNGKDVFVSLPTGSGKLLCIDCQGSRQTDENLMSILRTAKYFRDTFAACELDGRPGRSFLQKENSINLGDQQGGPVRVRNALMLYPEFFGMVAHSANVKSFFKR